MTRTTFPLAWAAFTLAGLAADAAPVYNNFVTLNGAGDNAGGTTVNAVSNSGAIVGFSSNANAPSSPISCSIPTGTSAR